MSAGASAETGGGSRKRGGTQDFELNLASIIDCLTVLITFMLASASFLSIGVLDAGIAAGGTEASGTPPPVNITIELKADHSMNIKLTGKETRNTTVTANKNERDLPALDRQLASIHSRWPAVNAATLSAENGVEYKDVVRTMETIRKSMPAVLLGGF